MRAYLTTPLKELESVMSIWWVEVGTQISPLQYQYCHQPELLAYFGTAGQHILSSQHLGAEVRRYRVQGHPQPLSEV